MLVVYSRYLAALWFNQFEINKIWQSAQSKKAQTLEKKNACCVPRGHFDSLYPPASSLHALLSPHWCENRFTDMGISMCVSARVPVCSTHLLICVCLCVILVCFLLFYFNAVSVLFRWTSCFELHLSTSAAGTHHLDERNRGFLMYAEHLNCMSLLLCSDLALEG